MKKRIIPIISMIISISFSLTSFAQSTQFTLELPESTVANTFIQVPEEKKVCSNDIISTITNYMRSEIDPNFDITYFDLTKIIDPDSNKITQVSLTIKAGDFTTNMGYSINIDENGCLDSLGINGNIDYINYKVCEKENIDIETLKKQAKDKFLEINPYSQDSSFQITDFQFYKFLDLGYMKAYYVFDFESTIDEMGHQRGYTLFYPIDATVIDEDYNKKITFSLNNLEVALPDGSASKMSNLYISSTGKVMLPLREALSFIDSRDLLWNEETKTAYIDSTTEDNIGYLHNINRLEIDCKNHIIVSNVDGNDFSYATDIEIRNNCIYIPLRDLLSAYGIKNSSIQWNENIKQITIFY